MQMKAGNAPKRVVVYPRVSSVQQREAGSIRAQLHAAPEYIAEREGWQLVRPVEHYADDGKSAKSGRLGDRDGLARIFEDAKAGEIDIVLVYDFDRLTRAEDWGERGVILGTLQQANVVIADMKGGWYDLNTSDGDIRASIGASMSADWMRKHKDRVRKGHARAIRENRMPKGAAPYGLKWINAERRFVIVEEIAEIVREIFRRVIARDRFYKIAADLNARNVPSGRASRYGWTRGRIFRIVRHTGYRGELCVQRAPRQTIDCPAIVPSADWYEAQKVIGSRARYYARRPGAAELLVGGVGVCGKCGARLVLNVSTHREGNPRYYICSARKTHHTCDNPIMYCDDVDPIVWESAREYIGTPGTWEKAIAVQHKRDGLIDWNKTIRECERRERQIAEREAAIADTFARGVMLQKTMDKALDELSKQRGEATAALQHAQSMAARAAGASAGPDLLGELRAALVTAPPKLRVQIVRRAVLAAELTPEGVRLTFNPALVDGERGPELLRGSPGSQRRRPLGADMDLSTGRRVHNSALTITCRFPSVKVPRVGRPVGARDRHPRRRSARR